LNAIALGRREGLLSVLIASEDPLARRALSAQLSVDPRLEIVGQAALSDAVGTIARDRGAEVLVIDAGLDTKTGIARARDLDLGDVVIVMLIQDPDAVREAYAAGARGMFTREIDGERLAAALLAIGAGAVVIDPVIADALIGAAHAPLPEQAQLTPREIEVLELLARGLSNKAIGEALGISDHTAKFHVNAIMNKLGAETRTEAVVLAAKLGLVAL
jgi:DNA-binding NarL/FixJ family response regulator